MGIPVHKPVLSWICEGGIKQSAYRIKTYANDQLVLDTGEVCSNSMSTVSGYEGKPRERIQWSISLRDENGMWGEESISHYEYGLTKDLIKASWINPELATDKEKRMPASVLKKEFTLDKIGEASHARLYITCHGMYEACLNGNRIGSFVLAPGMDDYNKRLQMQCYDITSLLKEGKNTLLVTLGDGLYRGNTGIDGTPNLFGTDISLL